MDSGSVEASLREVLEERGGDVSGLGVVLEWVQYKKNFREPVMARRFAGGDNGSLRGEIAIDARRLESCDLEASIKAALHELTTQDEPLPSRHALEELGHPSKSIIWSFNRSYWEHLSAWEATFANDYASALPGGVSDGTNPDYWGDQLRAFVERLVSLERRGLLPAEIYVLELGVGSGEQALMWLDTFAAICRERDREHYYDRLQYLMSDYSRDVLTTARATCQRHDARISVLNVDATNPLETLSFLRYKILFIHSCNLYDNLATNELLHQDGCAYDVLVRAYIEHDRAVEICASHGLDLEELVPAIERLLRIGPELFGDEKAGILFWADVWDAIRLEERYVQVDPAEIQLVPGVPLRLQDVIEHIPDNLRIQMSSVALESFANTIALLHPEGIFQVQDIFVRDLEQYRSFRGPGKMDGSIVNWLNGPLFRELGERLGFHVQLEPFTYREKSNTIVLTTEPKA